MKGVLEELKWPFVDLQLTDVFANGVLIVLGAVEDPDARNDIRLVRDVLVDLPAQLLDRACLEDEARVGGVDDTEPDAVVWVDARRVVAVHHQRFTGLCSRDQTGPGDGCTTECEQQDDCVEGFHNFTKRSSLRRCRFPSLYILPNISSMTKLKRFSRPPSSLHLEPIQ